MRPEGMGRFGSLIASTALAHQSVTAWLVAQTRGPASMTPAGTKDQRERAGTPEETMPQPKAHIGANQVIGFKSSRTAAGLGVSMEGTVCLTASTVNEYLHARSLAGSPYSM